MTVTTKLMALVAKLKFVVMVAVAAVAATLAALGGPAPPAHAQLFDLSGIYTRSVPTIAVDDEGTFNEANASCELGDTAVGGGYHFEEDLFSTHAYVSQPSTREDGTRPGHQWTIRMWSGGGGTGATVWVVCATGEAFGHGGGLRLARADSSVGPGSTGSVVATCPAGYKVLGGGYALDSSSFQFQNYAWVYGSYPSTPTQWRVDVNTVGEEAEPPVSITVSVEAWAICYPEIAPITLRTDSFAIPFPPFGAHEGAATCAGDAEMLGGGFRSSSKYLTVLRSSPPSADAWAVRVMPNLPAAPIDVTVYVFCHPNRPVVREAVELYAHGSLGGEVRRFDVAQSGQVMEVPDLSAFDFDDRTRSIRIYGPVFVSLYEHGNYGGRCETLRATDGQLLDNFIGAVAISSLRINVPCGTVELWDAPDFAGEVRRFTVDRSDQMVEEPILHLLGFNDRASSIRLIGSAFVSVYGNNHYGGRCETLRASDGRLADNFIGNDTISSLRVNVPCPVGTGEVAPTDQTVPRDAPIGVTLHYEVPESMAFRDLAWVELRLSDAQGPAVRVRLDEAANTLSVWDRASGQFSAARPIGSTGQLETPLAALDLGRSLWWEEAPASQGRGLRLVLWAGAPLPAGSYQLTLVARSDAGMEEQAAGTGTLTVGPAGGDRRVAALAQLGHLAEAVEGVGPGRSLAAQVRALQRLVEAGPPQRTHGACIVLDSFRRHVGAQQGRLLTAAQASHFQADVNTLPDLLRCF